MSQARSKEHDALSIAHHYDVSNEFYALFLDPLMVYTCAYYRDADGKLEQAQEDKLDLVCRKLRLQPGEHVLDIGCGWGGFSIWAAQHYGVRAHGVTLSRQQAEWAAARALSGAAIGGRLPIRVPPLAERREDIAELVDHFLDQISATTGLPRRRVGADALAVLAAIGTPMTGNGEAAARTPGSAAAPPAAPMRTLTPRAWAVAA